MAFSRPAQMKFIWSVEEFTRKQNTEAVFWVCGNYEDQCDLFNDNDKKKKKSSYGLPYCWFTDKVAKGKPKLIKISVIAD